MLAAAVFVLSTSSVAAQSSSDGWQVAIAPYLWAAGMDGTVAIADQQEDIDVPFSEIIEDLKFAFMGHFDMRNARWVLSSDLVFVDLEQEDEIANGTVTAGMELTLLEVAGGYRVSPAVSLLAGARWVDMGANLRYDGEIVGEDVSADKSWIDPLIGVHVFAPLSDRWWIGLRGDVGGFGVGSELTWQTYANIGWKASDLISIVLGYHALDMDYESDDRRVPVGVDLLVSGPQLGVVFTF